MAEICEACGVDPEGTWCRHPDLNTTICSREYTRYRKHGYLAPLATVRHWKKGECCESCGLGSEETTLRRHPDCSIRMTICPREYAHYNKYGSLSPLPTLRHSEKAEHCESCGTTEGRMERHPDRTIRMTICSREYVHYSRYHCLAPIPPIWKKTEHCESCGTTEGRMERHPTV